MNPLLSDDPADWADLVDSLRPAALLAIIEQRMSSSLRARTSPEDVLQEALLQVWKGRTELEWRGTRALRRYLLHIIEHVISDLADHHDAQKRGGAVRVDPLYRSSADGETGREFVPALSTTPSRVAMHRERAAAVHAALSSLPRELADVVFLRLLEERSTEDVARQLGLGISAVKHRLRRGLSLYRELVSQALDTKRTPETENRA